MVDAHRDAYGTRTGRVRDAYGTRGTRTGHTHRDVHRDAQKAAGTCAQKRAWDANQDANGDANRNPSGHKHQPPLVDGRGGWCLRPDGFGTRTCITGRKHRGKQARKQEHSRDVSRTQAPQIRDAYMGRVRDAYGTRTGRVRDAYGTRTGRVHTIRDGSLGQLRQWRALPAT